MRFCRQGPSLIVDAPAKLNLFLEVGGKRPDGYHELETLMVSIGLCDTLRFTQVPQPGVALHARFADDADRPGFPAGSDNLIVRAAQLLAQKSGYQGGVRIDVHKRIPSESGMGGGSSDAAATLVALNRLWRTGLDFDALDRLAAQLGSDLNFFVRSPRMAICRGRGELVEPQTLRRRLHFVVLRPRTGLSTAAVFGAWNRDAVATRQVDPLLLQLSSGSAASIGGQMFNALSPPAEGLSSEIAAALGLLRRVSGGPALMTGSGSACFCLCRGDSHARRVGQRLKAARQGRVWVVSTCI